MTYWDSPVSAHETPGRRTPVALLGRAGLARDRLREALLLAGARVVLEADPGEMDAQALHGAGPVAVLVALEPAIEDALDALEPALSAPGLMLIFDEAELAAHREGWDAQRWIRHLAAKLQGHGEVLPPGAESDPLQLHEAPISTRTDPVSALAASVVGAEPDPMADAAQDAAAVSAPASHAPAAQPVPGDSSNWCLVDVAVQQSSQRSHDFSHLPTGDLALEVVDEQPPLPAGVVLLIAGIGGPDAIRRLLAALPCGFPRAVLVRMALDGGQFGNLVRQMARVSTLPVELAAAGQPAQPGRVYILPDAVSLSTDGAALVFADGGDTASLLAALPVVDSAVLLLSGADEAVVEQVATLAVAGIWVAGQASAGCYDSAAATSLALRGQPTAEPAQLAQALAERWPAA